METLTAFFVSITIAGVPVSEVGPLPDGGSCEEMKRVIIADYERSFEVNHPFGYDASQWGINAIVLMDDHEFACVRRTLGGDPSA